YNLSITSNLDRNASLEVTDSKPAEARILEISPDPKEITATSLKWDLPLSSRQKMAVIYSYAVTRTESLGGL
ncbi:MAG TPA: hypothetical protein PKG66_08205, partial [Methanothrix sp.]|nr:hypothetical protein [Methanothrix sp.]